MIDKEQLLEEIVFLHNKLAHRSNASTQFIQALAEMGKPINDAIAAGLITLNTLHAPIETTCLMYNDWVTVIDNQLPRDLFEARWIKDKKIPGYGSAWYKDMPDPDIEDFLSSLPTTIFNYTGQLRNLINDSRGDSGLYPNAALATAIAAHLLDIKPHMAMSLVIEGRLSAWVTIYEAHYKDKGF